MRSTGAASAARLTKPAQTPRRYLFPAGGPYNYVSREMRRVRAKMLIGAADFGDAAAKSYVMAILPDFFRLHVWQRI